MDLLTQQMKEKLMAFDRARGPEKQAARAELAGVRASLAERLSSLSSEQLVLLGEIRQRLRPDRLAA